MADEVRPLFAQDTDDGSGTVSRARFDVDTHRRQSRQALEFVCQVVELHGQGLVHGGLLDHIGTSGGDVVLGERKLIPPPGASRSTDVFDLLQVVVRRLTLNPSGDLPSIADVIADHSDAVFAPGSMLTTVVSDLATRLGEGDDLDDDFAAAALTALRSALVAEVEVPGVPRGWAEALLGRALADRSEGDAIADDPNHDARLLRFLRAHPEVDVTSISRAGRTVLDFISAVRSRNNGDGRDIFESEVVRYALSRGCDIVVDSHLGASAASASETEATGFGGDSRDNHGRDHGIYCTVVAALVPPEASRSGRVGWSLEDVPTRDWSDGSAVWDADGAVWRSYSEAVTAHLYGILDTCTRDNKVGKVLTAHRRECVHAVVCLALRSGYPEVLAAHVCNLVLSGVEARDDELFGRAQYLARNLMIDIVPDVAAAKVDEAVSQTTGIKATVMSNRRGRLAKARAVLDVGTWGVEIARRIRDGLTITLMEEVTLAALNALAAVASDPMDPADGTYLDGNYVNEAVLEIDLRLASVYRALMAAGASAATLSIDERRGDFRWKIGGIESNTDGKTEVVGMLLRRYCLASLREIAPLVDASRFRMTIRAELGIGTAAKDVISVLTGNITRESAIQRLVDAGHIVALQALVGGELAVLQRITATIANQTAVSARVRKWVTEKNEATGAVAELVQAIGDGATLDRLTGLASACVSLDWQTDDGQVPLVVAAELGRVDVVVLLLNRGADPNAADVPLVGTSNTTGKTALIAAVRRGHTDVAERLLRDNRTNVRVVDTDGRGVLELAADVLADPSEPVKMLRLLLDRDAVVPRHLAESFYTAESLLFRLISSKRQDAASLVLLYRSDEMDVNSGALTSTGRVQTPLFAAVINRLPADFVGELVNTYGADVDTICAPTTGTTTTALMAAAGRLVESTASDFPYWSEVLGILVGGSRDPDKFIALMDPNGTPLDAAVRARNGEAATWLASRGFQYSNPRAVYFDACATGSLAAFEAGLPGDDGFDTTWVDPVTLNTGLHVAVHHDSLAIVKWFMENRPELVEARNLANDTMWLAASRSGATAVLSAVIEARRTATAERLDLMSEVQFEFVVGQMKRLKEAGEEVTGHEAVIEEIRQGTPTQRLWALHAGMIDSLDEAGHSDDGKDAAWLLPADLCLGLNLAATDADGRSAIQIAREVGKVASLDLIIGACLGGCEPLGTAIVDKPLRDKSRPGGLVTFDDLSAEMGTHLVSLLKVAAWAGPTKEHEVLAQRPTPAEMSESSISLSGSAESTSGEEATDGGELSDATITLTGRDNDDQRLQSGFRVSRSIHLLSTFAEDNGLLMRPEDVLVDRSLAGFVNQGGFGTIWRGVYRRRRSDGRCETGMYACVVKLLKADSKDPAAITEQINEATLLGTVGRFGVPHLARLVGIVPVSGLGIALVIGLEAESAGRLRSVGLSATRDEELRVVFEVTSGLRYLHTLCISHLDLKPDNFLFSFLGSFLVCDLGGSGDPSSPGKLHVTQKYLAESLTDDARFPLAVTDSRSLFKVIEKNYRRLTSDPSFVAAVSDCASDDSSVWPTSHQLFWRFYCLLWSGSSDDVYDQLVAAVVGCGSGADADATLTEYLAWIQRQSASFTSSTPALTLPPEVLARFETLPRGEFLVLAAIFGRLDVAEAILSADDSSNPSVLEWRDAIGNSALFYAAAHNHVDVLAAILGHLQTCPSALWVRVMNGTNFGNMGALHGAIGSRATEAIDMILDAYEALAEDGNGDAVVDGLAMANVQGMTPFLLASTFCQPEVLIRLIRLGAASDDENIAGIGAFDLMSGGFGARGARNAARAISAVDEVLDERGRPKLALSTQFPLHSAAMSGSEEIVGFALEHVMGAIDKPNGEGVTPLMIAVQNGFHNVIDVLEDAGADLDREVSMAGPEADDGTKVCALELASDPAVRNHLLDLGAGKRLLIEAVGRYSTTHAEVDEAAIRRMLDLGVDLTMEDGLGVVDGPTLLHHAVATCDQDLLDLLLAYDNAASAALAVSRLEDGVGTPLALAVELAAAKDENEVDRTKDGVMIKRLLLAGAPSSAVYAPTREPLLHAMLRRRDHLFLDALVAVWLASPLPHAVLGQTAIKASIVDALTEAEDGSGATPLHVAVEVEDQTAVEMVCMVEPAKVSLKTRNRNGQTPLAAALLADEDDLKLATTLLAELGVFPDVDDGAGCPLLVRAVREDDVAKVELLVTHRASVGAQDETSGNTAVIEACREDRVGCLMALTTKLLPGRVIELCADADRRGNTPLIAASAAGSVGCLNVLSAVLPSDEAFRQLLSVTNNDGNNAVMVACAAGNMDCLQVLAAKLSSDEGHRLLSVTNNDGNNAVMVACAAGNMDCLQVLTTDLASDEAFQLLSATNNDGNNAVMVACAAGNMDCLQVLTAELSSDEVHRLLSATNNDGINAPMVACAAGEVNCLKVLTQERPLDEVLRLLRAAAVNDGNNAVMVACAAGSVGCLKVLTAGLPSVEVCRLLSATNNDGNNAVMVACAAGEVNCLKVLTAGLPSVEVCRLLSATNNDGDNAVMVVCAAGKVNCLKVLTAGLPSVEVCRLLSATNDDGDNAVMVACAANELGCLKVLTRGLTAEQTGGLFADCNDDGNCAVHLAICHANGNGVDLLAAVLEHVSVDVLDLCNNNGQTPAELVYSLEDKGLVRAMFELLFAAGLSPDVRVGGSPLVCAAAVNDAPNLDLVRMALDGGADPNSIAPATVAEHDDLGVDEYPLIGRLYRGYRDVAQTEVEKADWLNAFEIALRHGACPHGVDVDDCTRLTVDSMSYPQIADLVASSVAASGEGEFLMPSESSVSTTTTSSPTDTPALSRVNSADEDGASDSDSEGQQADATGGCNEGGLFEDNEHRDDGHGDGPPSGGTARDRSAIDGHTTGDRGSSHGSTANGGGGGGSDASDGTDTAGACEDRVDACTDCLSFHTEAPLVAAVRNEAHHVITYLLAQGANPDVTTCMGDPLVVFASRRGDDKAVRLLMRSKLLCGLTRTAPGSCDTALVCACRLGHVDVALALLRRWPKELLDGAGDYGLTPLMHAYAHQSERLTRKLLKHGASPDVTDADGVPLTALAALDGRWKVLRRILKCNPDGIPLLPVPGTGETALDIARRRGAVDVVDWLVQEWPGAGDLPADPLLDGVNNCEVAVPTYCPSRETKVSLASGDDDCLSSAKLPPEGGATLLSKPDRSVEGQDGVVAFSGRVQLAAHFC